MPTHHRPINPRQGGAPPAALVRAMQALQDVSKLLEALSPEEIAKTASRAHLDRRGDSQAACWRLFEARHRALLAALATQRASLSKLVRDHIEKE